MSEKYSKETKLKAVKKHLNDGFDIDIEILGIKRVEQSA